MTNWDEQVSPDIERFAEALLDSATADTPSDAAFRRTAATLGLTSLLGSGVLLASGAARAASGMFAKIGEGASASASAGAASAQAGSVAAGSGLVLVKWAGAGLLVGITTVGVTQAVFPKPTESPSYSARATLPVSGLAPSGWVGRSQRNRVVPQVDVEPAIVEAVVVVPVQSEKMGQAAVPVGASRVRSQANSVAAGSKHVAEIVGASLASVDSVHKRPVGALSAKVSWIGAPDAAAAGPSDARPVARDSFAPSAASAVPVAGGDQLPEEVRLVDALRSAIARRDVGTLKELLARYDREHPTGELRAEVAAIRARAAANSR